MSTSGPPRIRVLAPALADQIAAGEVVERPASLVKELVENALDAGARRIDVEIDAGGRRMVRVVDDGCGMTPEEARLALERHATSKIARVEDLWGLETFGFRGEALPSIAAVSRLSLKTKMADAAAGYRLLLEGGREVEAGEAGVPDGTQVEVRDLFFNTPARLKFLKAEASETGAISEAVLRLALANPSVHFRLRAGGRTLLDLPPHPGLAERARAGLMRRGGGQLVEASGEEAGNTVRAFLGAPEDAPTTSRSTFLFVGRRFVRDRSLMHALSMGYGELLERGRYPLAALFVEVPGQALDVNVHPQKLEVRFSRPQEVYGAVRHVVRRAVEAAPWLAAPVAAPVRAYTLPPERSGRPEPRGDGGTMPLPRLGAAWRGSGDPPASGAVRGDAGAADAEPAGTSDDAPDEESAGAAIVMRDESPDPARADGRGGVRSGFFSGLGYIGQLHRTYLVCESPDELVLVDQHAAHERVAFQRLRGAYRQKALARQRLLFPTTIEVDESAGVPGPEILEVLGGLGFDVEPFGPGTLLVRAVPELLRAVDPKPLLRDVLDKLSDGVAPERAEQEIDHVLATMACHSVVRAGDRLGHEQAVALLAQLDAVDLRSHCPHGRPVLLRMSAGELERRFGRA